MATIIWNITKFVLILILPFFLLIRGSIYVHENYGYGAYPSLIIGLVATSILLFLYMTMVYRYWTKSLGDEDNLQRRMLFAFMLVSAYCAYGLFFLSADNFKNSDLKKEVNQMHPILRLGVSTFILIDKDMIITDGSRLPEDYKKMGLKTPRNSLHYPQKDGYAYALDLRTNNRNEVRNQLMTLYFKILGFNILRHTGTADHLHISLPCHYAPGAR